jgi:selenocysteine lyase/cysteine desulfurase
MSNLWQEFRGEMPVCQRYAYFDHAAVSPLPNTSAEAVRLWLQESVDSGDAHWPAWAGRVEKARRTVAEGLNADSEEIAFVSSTTEGITMAAEGLDWRPGDQVVIFGDEFPTNIYPWLNLASRQVETVRVPAPRQPRPEDLLNACSEQTRLISISWVSFATGWRFDIASLVEQAHRRGILVFLDAIQGMGVFALDVKAIPVDFLAADGHKWMLGPEGAGVFYLRREHLERLRPIKVGWNSMVHAHNFQQTDWNLRPDAKRYEGGSQNMVGVHALGASLSLLSRFGWGCRSNSLGDRVVEIASLACDRLLSAGAVLHSERGDPSNCSGIVAFEMPGRDSQELRDKAFRADVVLSCRNGRLRIAPHAYNNQDDIDRLIDVLTS